MARSILITNDDGIDAEGLKRLVIASCAFGDVTVVAPSSQRSAASHSITLHSTIDVFPHDIGVEGVKAYSCSGTPADCVRVGSLSIMEKRPDFVFSGINRGYNVASDIQYSATAGAAFEGAFQGYLSIAFSEGFEGLHEVTDAYLPGLIGELIERPFIPGRIINVNFPECTLEECGGILYDRTVSTRMIYRDTYKETEKLPDGGVRLMVDGHRNYEAEEGTDLRAIFDRFVSVGTVPNIGF
ncbi:MAG: 5'/3'-nucleotidase SurE [Lachnospiraceae bacterium]|nr:5'/3'-nucleotidase SurE [Lachnospiraceae bacterium]